MTNNGSGLDEANLLGDSLRLQPELA